jgi:hypothetical protein
MPSRYAVLLPRPVSVYFTQLPSCQQSASINLLDATLADSLASAANKRLTPNVSPVDATLTKKRGIAEPLTLQRSNVQMRYLHPGCRCGTCNDLRPNSFPITFLATPHQLTPYLSHSYKNHRGEGVFPTFQHINAQTFKRSYPFSFHIVAHSFAQWAQVNSFGISTFHTLSITMGGGGALHAVTRHSSQPTMLLERVRCSLLRYLPYILTSHASCFGSPASGRRRKWKGRREE